MCRRLGIFLLVLFQAFWLNVLLPGHTRGQIVMAGSRGVERACCMGEDSSTPSKHSSEPSKNRVANCAVCAFAAHLTVPPVIDLTLRPTDLLCLLPEPRLQSVTTLELVLAYLGRAPPVA